MGLFLTNSELQELTGYKTASKQIFWLRNHGYFVETNARGIPRITYSQIEEMRRNAVSKTNIHSLNQALNSEPNFESLRIKINKMQAYG